MSLATPDKIRTLQRKLYLKAKQEPSVRFHQLYDKVYRADILEHAYLLCKSNGGSAGVDEQRFDDIENQGRSAWLEALGKDLHDKTYRPSPVKRVMIPKPGGGDRPLGIPTIRDRVAQTAAKLVLEPIFEADFADSAYGYRPGRSAVEAVQAVHEAIQQGYTQVISPLLANIYMHRYLRCWEQTGQGERLRAKIINYADDFVILSRGKAAEALRWTERVMGGLKLTLNAIKTCIRNAVRESFDFLGYTFGRMFSPRTGGAYLGARPSIKSVRRLRQKLHTVLHRGNIRPWPEVAEHANRILRGWANYFSHGTLAACYKRVDQYVGDRARNLLRRRHKIRGNGFTCFPDRVIFGEMGVLRLMDLRATRATVQA